MCKPKHFAGLFSAAPSVLFAGLIITLFTTGAAPAILTAQGAIAGAGGMIVFCLLATPAIKRYKTLGGSLVALGGWFLGSFLAFTLLSQFVR